jgi:hypothetical protein
MIDLLLTSVSIFAVGIIVLAIVSATKDSEGLDE